jgi:hypothetical protein
MKKAVCLFILGLFITVPVSAEAGVTPSYAGSSSCLECHQKFYQLWSTSRHGLAMQPYNGDFAQKELTPQEKDIVIRKNRYRADLKYGVVVEKGPNGLKKYKIEHVLGGKERLLFPDASGKRQAPDPSGGL